jgi:hypothetical protein
MKEGEGIIFICFVAGVSLIGVMHHMVHDGVDTRIEKRSSSLMFKIIYLWSPVETRFFDKRFYLTSTFNTLSRFGGDGCNKDRGQYSNLYTTAPKPEGAW